MLWQCIYPRNFFEDLLIETSLISPCYTYRNKRSDETEWDYGQRVAKELEDEILNLGPDNVMAFIAETVWSESNPLVVNSKEVFFQVIIVSQNASELLPGGI